MATLGSIFRFCPSNSKFWEPVPDLEDTIRRINRPAAEIDPRVIYPMHGGKAPTEGAWVQMDEYAWYPVDPQAFAAVADILRLLKADGFFAAEPLMFRFERGVEVEEIRF